MSPSLTRKIPISILAFKSLGGLGIGFAGTLIILIFIFVASVTTKAGQSVGPFFTFMALVTALVTSIVTNSLALTAFTMIDREKYPPVRPVLQHMVTLNVIIFIFLLPIYVLAATRDNQTVFMIVAIQLLLSAQASCFALELSVSREQRDQYLAVYGVSFGMVLTAVLGIVLFSIVAAATTTVSAETGRATNVGATAVLFGILPLTWLFFGLCTTIVEMLYDWAYEVFGVDYLSQDNPNKE